MGSNFLNIDDSKQPMQIKSEKLLFIIVQKCLRKDIVHPNNMGVSVIDIAVVLLTYVAQLQPL